MSDNKTILVAGGAGYIGSHTIVCLLQANYNVVVVDNLVNSSPVSLDRVAEIVGLDEEERKTRVVFHQVDICDEAALRKVFETSPKFEACIHFAGLKVCFDMNLCEGENESRIRLQLTHHNLGLA